MQVKTVQYGAGERGKRSRVHGELVCGPETLSDGGALAKNRCDFGNEIRAHPLDDDYHRARSPIWSKVTVPFLSAANWGGQALHPRGNFEGFVRAASKDKWLEAHGIEHWTHFYTDYGRQSAEALLRSFPARQEQRLGQAAARCSCRCATSTVSSSAPRTNGRSRARNGRSSISIRRRQRSRDEAGEDESQHSLRRHGRRRHLPHARRSSTKRRSPGLRR